MTYTKAQAIYWLGKVGKDKTTTMFSSLVPAMLNILIGNDGTCVSAAIAAGNAWMATYGPVGSGVPGGSAAWAAGEPTHMTLEPTTTVCCARLTDSKSVGLTGPWGGWGGPIGPPYQPMGLHSSSLAGTDAR